jgi:hypothetical protein
MSSTITRLAVAFVLGTSAIAAADHPVTIVLRSGQQLSGRFADLHMDLVYLRANQREEPRIPLSDIAVIDFTNSRGVRDPIRLGSGRDVLVLRNGRQVEGRFEGLTGDERPHTADHPLEFVFSTTAGEQVRVNADRISRIHLAPVRDGDDTFDGTTTVWLDDGTSFRGAIAALGGRELAFRSSRAGLRDRRYTLDEVDVIDFEGTGRRPDEESRVGRRGAHLLVMRNGRRVQGEFIGAERTAGAEGPYLFRAQNGRLVTFTPDTAARLYLGSSDSLGSLDRPAGWDAAGSIAVPAQQAWTRTGLNVRRGDVIQFTSRGEVQLSDADSDRASPNGTYSGRGAANAPLRDVPAGALIGRIGNSVFVIGEGTRTVRMPSSGELILGVNDDHMPDNRGSFEVRVRRQPVGS